LKEAKGVDMGILSPFIWPLYESGAIIPILGVLLILAGILYAFNHVQATIFIPIGIGLLVAGIIFLRKKAD
jgi:uncharacterized membrane protein HdeD (DUF308 family)